MEAPGWVHACSTLKQGKPASPRCANTLSASRRAAFRSSGKRSPRRDWKNPPRFTHTAGARAATSMSHPRRPLPTDRRCVCPFMHAAVSEYTLPAWHFPRCRRGRPFRRWVHRVSWIQAAAPSRFPIFVGRHHGKPSAIVSAPRLLVRRYPHLAPPQLCPTTVRSDTCRTSDRTHLCAL